MRRPRVRFTMGSIVFAVVLIAADCWYLRPPAESSVDFGGIMVPDPSPFDQFREGPIGLGILPLLNALALGCWCTAVGRLRAWRKPEGTETQIPAFTFFCLHFLAIGVLVYAFLPEMTSDVWEIVYGVGSWAEDAWEARFGDLDDPGVAKALDLAARGTVLSGPPLLLAGIGAILARLYATKVTRARLRVMTGLVSACFAGVAVTICTAPQEFREDIDIPVDIWVVDESSRDPIAAASVRMPDPYTDRHGDPEPTPSSSTGIDGHARLVGRFDVQGERNAFWTMGHFDPWGRWLEIVAPGYRTRRIALTELLGPLGEATKLNAATIALSRGETPPDSCADLAGKYYRGRGPYGGCWLEIEPDGRFAWCAYGCTFDLREYGHIVRHDQALELQPVPHVGTEVHPKMERPFRVIVWGDRRYIVDPRGGIDDLCRAALTPTLLRDPEDGCGCFLRPSDEERPLAGMPELTASDWVGYLWDEIRPDNPFGTLHAVLDPLNPWR